MKTRNHKPTKQKPMKSSIIAYTEQLGIAAEFRPSELVQKESNETSVVMKLKLTNDNFYRDPLLSIEMKQLPSFLTKVIMSMLACCDDKHNVTTANVFKEAL